MKQTLLLSILFLCFSTTVKSQDTNAKYLAGAVTEVNGKVVFSRTISPKKEKNDALLFDIISQWTKQNYGIDSNSRILMSDSVKREIACQENKPLIFTKDLLILDQSMMSYILILKIEEGKCLVSIKNIKYEYNLLSKKGGEEIYPAEEMITDKHALNKNKKKLNRRVDKFRIKTIDAFDSICESISSSISPSSTITIYE